MNEVFINIMINEQSDINSFLKDILRRPDGRVLIISCLLGLIMLLANLTCRLYEINFREMGREKWLVMWLFSQPILTLLYIRLRQLIDANGGFVVAVHSLVLIGFVLFFALKNLDLL